MSLRRFYTVEGLTIDADGERIYISGTDQRTKQGALQEMRRLANQHAVDVFKLHRWGLRNSERAYEGFRIAETETWEIEAGKMTQIHTETDA